MTGTNVGLTKLVASFEQYTAEIARRVRGYKDPESGTEVYPGLRIKEDIDKLLSRATDPKSSYVSVRDVEYLFNRVEDVWFDAKIVLIEINKAMRQKTVRENITVMKELKSIRDEVADYCSLLQEKYDFMSKVAWAASDINTSLRRAFKQDTETYNTDSEEVVTVKKSSSVFDDDKDF